ncbi:MAG: radical SAM protein [Kofleriaceae bacterium]
MTLALERLSIELHDRCRKACWFCYSHSGPEGAAAWQPDDVVALVRDCAARGVAAVSFGGGEPLEYPGLFAVLTALRGRLYRSITTSGLDLDAQLDRLAACAPERVHVSIHAPGNAGEVARVLRQVAALRAAGIPSGVNLLVRASQLPDARAAAAQLRAAGIGNDRIAYLPMRGQDTPTPAQLGAVAGGAPFQSMTCLAACGKSPRFASLDSQGRAAWCSYTRTRAPLGSLTFDGLVRALAPLGVEPCARPPARARPLLP